MTGIGISFIIVNFNTRDLLDACLASIYAQTRGVCFEIIVVDNASSDDSAAMVRTKYPAVRLMCSSTNAGFGAANNTGAAQARGRHLLLLNSDAQLITDSAAGLCAFLDSRADAGCAGPRIELYDGSPQPRSFGRAPGLRTLFNDVFLLQALFPGSMLFPAIHETRPAATISKVGWVSGVCMAIPRAAFAQAGGFDPAYFMYAEDMDLCLRLARLGRSTYHIDDFPVRHLLGGSTKTDAAVVRNCLLQQRHFLRLLDCEIGRRGRLLARLLIAAGLVLRVCAGAAGAAAGKGNLLLRTSRARLADLAGGRSLPCA